MRKVNAQPPVINDKKLKMVFVSMLIAIALAAIPGTVMAAIIFDGTPDVIGQVDKHLTSAVNVDVDNDGDLDVVAGASSWPPAPTYQVIIWENNGLPFMGSWNQLTIATTQAGFIGSNSINAADLDNDNDMDLVLGVSSEEDNEIIILENDGSPFNNTWPQHDVGSSGTTQNTTISLADLDNDSWTDIVSMATAYSGTPSNVMIWKNDGTPFSNLWSGQPIFTSYALGPGMDTGDLDNDGDEDIIIGYSEYNVGMLQNDGTPFSGSWSSHYVGAGCAGMVGDIEAVDLDSDNYLDLATACGYLPTYPQRVWRNDGSPFNNAWSANTVVSISAPNLDVADLDMDGDQDVIYGTNQGHVRNAENDGTPFSGSWGISTLGPDGQWVNAVANGDLDNDGDEDIVSLNKFLSYYGIGYSKVNAWENLTIFLVNDPPVIGSAGDVSVNEGTTATNTGIVSDPDGDYVTLTASAGTVTNNGDGTWSWSMDAVDGPADSQTITITADDGEGGTAQTSFGFTVGNVAPSVGQVGGPAYPVLLGATVNVSTAFSDPGILDTHTAIYEWGDGNNSAAGISETGGSGTASGSYAYATAGVYTLKLTVSDNDGGSAYSIYEYAVVYDPSAGFVTGGGWINSPAGAYAADPTLTGKASFGFVSKYQKGAMVPTGQTQFQFNVAGLNFHSSSYDWLVIGGFKAQYKGTGTINGTGSYGFMLTATDGQLTGGGGMDRFRIKIWDKATGAIVYDNMIGSADTDSPTTMLGGGSIVIHK